MQNIKILKNTCIFKIFYELFLIYNVVLISAEQQSDSVTHVYTFLYILFHSGLSEDVEYSSLCYSVGLVIYPSCM